MENNQNIEIEGIRYLLIWTKASHLIEQKEEQERICPLSQKRIKPGDNIVIVVNGNEVFPNKIALADEMNEKGIVESLTYMKESYESYRSIQTSYPEWTKTIL